MKVWVCIPDWYGESITAECQFDEDEFLPGADLTRGTWSDWIFFEDTRWDDVIGFSRPNEGQLDGTEICLEVRDEKGVRGTRFVLSKEEEDRYPGAYAYVLDHMVFELEELMK